MRRGHDGLSALVRNHWDVDIYGGHLFVFVGRRPTAARFCFGTAAVLSCTTNASSAGVSACLNPGGRELRSNGSTELAMLLDRHRRRESAQTARWTRPHQTRQPPREVFPDHFDHLRDLRRKGIDKSIRV